MFISGVIISSTEGGPEGYLTLANQNEIYNTIANQAAIAADFYIVGVPAIAGFILFASFQALSGIASGVAGSVSAFSGNQTLNQERANIAALDKINERINANDPLYTGNIGTVQTMMAQDSALSQASKAAGAFLGSGSSMANFDNLAKMKMSSSSHSAAEELSKTRRLDSRTGGYLNTSTDVSAAQGTKDAANKIGEYTPINDYGAVDKMKKSAEVNISDGMNKGFERGNSLEETFGSIKEGTSVSAKVGEGLTVQTLDKNLKIADDNTDKLIDIQSTSGAKPTAEAKASQDIVKDRGNDYFDQVERQSRNREDKEMSRLVAEKESNIIEDDGRLNNKGQEIVETQTQTPIENTKAELNALGGKEEVLDTKSKEAAGKIVEEQSKQEILNSNGGYLNNMADKGTFDGAQTVGKNQAMNTIGTGAIIQDSEVKTITSAGSSQGEINALKSMQNAGLLGKDVSLYEKKISDGGYFSAVDDKGNRITMYTDSKGNILGYEKQTVDSQVEGGKGAGVRSIHKADGTIVAKIEDGSNQKNYQNKKDLSITTDYTMENKGAAYAGLNEKLREDMANAKTQMDKETVVKEFLDATRRVDSIASPTEMSKVIAKEAETGTLGEAMKQNYDDKVSDRGKEIDSAIFNGIKDAGESLAKNVPGGAVVNKAILAVDDFFNPPKGN